MTSWHDKCEVIIIITVWLAGTYPCRVRLGEVRLGVEIKGPLDWGGGGGEGSHMSHVDFKKRPCHMSLRKDPCH